MSVPESTFNYVLPQDFSRPHLASALCEYLFVVSAVLLVDVQTLSEEDILDVTKIESQSLLLKKDKFNLNQLILNAVADSRNQFTKENKENNLKIELGFKGEEDIYVEADKNRTNQVVSNLLGNAIKFTKEGTITITTEKKEEDDYYDHSNREVVVVAIKDSGTGIDVDMLPKLFTKFTSSSTRRDWIGFIYFKKYYRSSCRQNLGRE